MSEKVKLIWDFRGPNAEKTALHHIIHLNEYIKSEGIIDAACDVEKLSEMNTTAYMIVDKEHMEVLRVKLKPHRGQLYNP